MITALIRRRFKRWKRPLLWLRDRPSVIYTVFVSLWHGIEVSGGLIFLGRPRISLYRRGSLKIGRKFRGVSNWRRNSIGVSAPLTIITSTHDAIISIGENCGMSGVTLSARQYIIIGNDVYIGSGAMIIDSDMHDLSGVGSHLHDEAVISRGVTIGDSVFIGARAIILKGVSIGSGSVVGAGALVTRDVPQGSVVVAPVQRVFPRN